MRNSAADIWRKYDGMERRLTAALSQRMLDLAGLATGMNVLDIATGRGEPAIPAAKRVAPTGRVLGVDVSGAMLQMARERADAEGVANLELRVTPAESLDGVPSEYFDASLARWGLMYFSSPLDALRAIHRALIPGRVLVAALWAQPHRVPYYALPRKILEKYRALPTIDFDAPGVFRYAHVDTIFRDFAAAGLTVEHIEECDSRIMEAESEDDLIAWVRAFGFERLVNDLPAAIQAAWAADLVQETRALSASGDLALGGVTRIVVARKNAQTTR